MKSVSQEWKQLQNQMLLPQTGVTISSGDGYTALEDARLLSVKRVVEISELSFELPRDEITVSIANASDLPESEFVSVFLRGYKEDPRIKVAAWLNVGDSRETIEIGCYFIESVSGLDKDEIKIVANRPVATGDIYTAFPVPGGVYAASGAGMDAIAEIATRLSTGTYIINGDASPAKIYNIIPPCTVSQAVQQAVNAAGCDILLKNNTVVIQKCKIKPDMQDISAASDYYISPQISYAKPVTALAASQDQIQFSGTSFSVTGFGSVAETKVYALDFSGGFAIYDQLFGAVAPACYVEFCPASEAPKYALPQLTASVDGIRTLNNDLPSPWGAIFVWVGEEYTPPIGATVTAEFMAEISRPNVTQVVPNRQGQNAGVFKLNNSVGHPPAETVAEILNAYMVTVDHRFDPRLEAGDFITVWDGKADRIGRVIKMDVTYNGGWRSKTTLRLCGYVGGLAKYCDDDLYLNDYLTEGA